MNQNSTINHGGISKCCSAPMKEGCCFVCQKCFKATDVKAPNIQTKKQKNKVIRGWAIATKKGNGFYLPASFKIEQKRSINEWFAIGIMWDKVESKSYCAFLKRHGLDKSFKVIPCEIHLFP